MFTGLELKPRTDRFVRAGFVPMAAIVEEPVMAPRPEQLLVWLDGERGEADLDLAAVVVRVRTQA